MHNAGHDVTLWGWLKSENDQLRELRENVPLLKGVKIPDAVKIVDSIDGIEKADAVILATPTVGVRSTVKLLAQRLRPGAPLACVSKGLEPKTLKTFDMVSAEELPDTSFVALSGPSHAEEIARGVPTTLVAASKSLESAQKIQDLTSDTQIRIYTSDDVLGVELGGALKNVIAFAAGIVDGMGGGDNTKAALMTRGLTEIARLGRAMGARTETFAGFRAWATSSSPAVRFIPETGAAGYTWARECLLPGD
jgi:glycerol-3-phosphate dehydrogenase (NAD(P)+)